MNRYFLVMTGLPNLIGQSDNFTITTELELL